MAPYSSTLAWKIPWTEEPGGLHHEFQLRMTLCRVVQVRRHSLLAAACVRYNRQIEFRSQPVNRLKTFVVGRGKGVEGMQLKAVDNIAVFL